ncbi:hypothetical protein R6Q59_007505 [Mikania micrantha]
MDKSIICFIALYLLFSNLTNGIAKTVQDECGRNLCAYTYSFAPDVCERVFCEDACQAIVPREQFVEKTICRGSICIYCASGPDFCPP